ncbi:cAMP dependent protein kinase regulatory subunit [Phycomyces nitens]|nr:cAMP dependent protein kinase regulatory subunit [Phycomyces nitens]
MESFQDIHPSVPSPESAVPDEYHSLLNDLNRQVHQEHPKDIIQFCIDFFKGKLEERKKDSLHGTLFDTPETTNSEMCGGETLNVPFSRGRRTSVSAESIQPSQTPLKKIVIPKDIEQRKQIRSAIQNNFLFKNMDDDQYNDIVNAMAERRVEDGQIVIKQGGVGDYFYIVQLGTFDCLIDNKRVTSYGPGGSFGELALMYNAPRAATIVATSEGVLWALDRVTFRSIVVENTAKKRMMYEHFLEEVPLFKSLNKTERHKISDALESIQFEDKDVVIKQGDFGDNFYLIEDGEAIFYKKDKNGKERQVNTAVKGDYFGELALINDQPRAATVVANGRLRCATLGKNAFTRLLGPIMDILKRNSPENDPEQ